MSFKISKSQRRKIIKNIFEQNKDNVDFPNGLLRNKRKTKGKTFRVRFSSEQMYFRFTNKISSTYPKIFGNGYPDINLSDIIDVKQVKLDNNGLTATIISRKDIQ